MGSFRRYLSTFLLLLGVAPFTGCLFRTRRVEQNISTVALKSATKPELVGYINAQAAHIQTMKANVDIDTSVGGAKKGRVTEYPEIRGYVLARKPAMLRMIGLLPLIHETAFDMVSDGQEFKLSIPPKNRFVVGRNDFAPLNPQQPLESLRPQTIYDALLLRAIDLERQESPVLFNDWETIIDEKGRKLQQPVYVIDVNRMENGNEFLARRIIFNRVNLLPERQIIYDQTGSPRTDARYSDYKDFNGVLFPSVIEIRRPEEEYNIRLHIVELEINMTLDSSKFVLEKPPGATVIRLPDHQQAASSGGGTH
jgi:outer membrane lipoprotein-sorting protein